MDSGATTTTDVLPPGGLQVSPPPTAVRALELGQDSEAGLADYTRLVESDPALADTILALANGPLYAGLPACESLSVAVVRVGPREVERLALRRALDPQVFGIAEDNDIALEIGRHSWLAGLAAQTVARRIGAPSVTAFQAGLFHDIGELAFLGTLTRTGGDPDRGAPTSAEICRKWGLPRGVVSAIARRHAGGLPQDLLSCAVLLGDHIARALQGESDSLGSPAIEEAVAACGLTDQDLWELTAMTADQAGERESQNL